VFLYHQVLQIDLGLFDVVRARGRPAAPLTLVEETTDYFWTQSAASYPNTRCTEVKNEPFYSHVSLVKLNGVWARTVAMCRWATKTSASN
jgi:hypothetical protein